MDQKRIGVVVTAPNSAAALEDFVQAEQLGISAGWVTSGSAGGADNLTLLAGVAARTGSIMFGTAIAQSFSRHPVAVAQQALALAQLAPGRFRLGVGPGGRAGVERTFGVDYRSPLGHLREYLRVLKALLQQGLVDFDGRYYQAHTQVAAPVDVPVMASALGAKAFQLCGAEADGAISWLCPVAYLRDVALPAMKTGAERAGRPAPSLIAHVPVCVHDNLEEVRAGIRQRFGFFARSPAYQSMFAAAGFPEAAAQGVWSDAMIDAVTLYGTEAQVSDKLKDLLAIGATEVMASPVPAGSDQGASLGRTMRLLAQVEQSMRV